jgi:hypothetical protein
MRPPKPRRNCRWVERTQEYIAAVLFRAGVTNADPDSVAMWIEKLREIHSLGVQVYTLDREPADKKLEKVSLTTLRWITDAVRWRAGLQSEVF